MSDGKSGPITTVVNKRSERFDVYIGRPSKWGNPFVIGEHGTREQVIAKYEAWIKTQPQIADLAELRGKVLGCFCAPKPCHGDVLARLADERYGSPFAEGADLGALAAQGFVLGGTYR